MIHVLSPAKTIVANLTCSALQGSVPVFQKQAEILVKHLQRLSLDDLARLMKISPKLAMLNFDRYQLWNHEDTPLLMAVCAFKGEVFNALKAWEMSKKDLDYAQDHMVILSGLYGLLSPLDWIKPYRLEMATEMEFGSLYGFWGLEIGQELKRRVTIDGGPLINLASKEYYKVLQINKLKIPVITPEFRDYQNGKYKMVAVYAKKARGLMSKFIIENRISNSEELKVFSDDGYYFNTQLSSSTKFVFTR